MGSTKHTYSVNFAKASCDFIHHMTRYLAMQQHIWPPVSSPQAKEPLVRWWWTTLLTVSLVSSVIGAALVGADIERSNGLFRRV